MTDIFWHLLSKGEPVDISGNPSTAAGDLGLAAISAVREAFPINGVPHMVVASCTKLVAASRAMDEAMAELGRAVAPVIECSHRHIDPVGEDALSCMVCGHEAKRPEMPGDHRPASRRPVEMPAEHRAPVRHRDPN